MAKVDDLPIIHGPLMGKGEAPEVRPPSILEKERLQDDPGHESNGRPNADEDERRSLWGRLADTLGKVGEKLGRSTHRNQP